MFWVTKGDDTKPPSAPYTKEVTFLLWLSYMNKMREKEREIEITQRNITAASTPAHDQFQLTLIYFVMLFSVHARCFFFSRFHFSWSKLRDTFSHSFHWRWNDSISFRIWRQFFTHSHRIYFTSKKKMHTRVLKSCNHIVVCVSPESNDFLYWFW